MFLSFHFFNVISFFMSENPLHLPSQQLTTLWLAIMTGQISIFLSSYQPDFSVFYALPFWYITHLICSNSQNWQMLEVSPNIKILGASSSNLHMSSVVFNFIKPQAKGNHHEIILNSFICQLSSCTLLDYHEFRFHYVKSDNQHFNLLQILQYIFLLSVKQTLDHLFCNVVSKTLSLANMIKIAQYALLSALVG